LAEEKIHAAPDSVLCPLPPVSWDLKVDPPDTGEMHNSSRKSSFLRFARLFLETSI